MNCILVVERDEERVRSRVRSLAATATPVGVTTAADALHLLATSVFDAIVCADVLGPGQPSGEALLRVVGRRWPATRRYLVADVPRATSAALLLEPLTPTDLARVADGAVGADGADASPPGEVELEAELAPASLPPASRPPASRSPGQSPLTCTGPVPAAFGAAASMH